MFPLRQTDRLSDDQSKDYQDRISPQFKVVHEFGTWCFKINKLYLCKSSSHTKTKAAFWLFPSKHTSESSVQMGRFSPHMLYIIFQDCACENISDIVFDSRNVWHHIGLRNISSHWDLDYRCVISDIRFLHDVFESHDHCRRTFNTKNIRM